MEGSERGKLCLAGLRRQPVSLSAFLVHCFTLWFTDLDQAAHFEGVQLDHVEMHVGVTRHVTGGLWQTSH